MEIKLEKVGINKYRLPRTADMKADAIVYANKSILKEIGSDRSLEQLQEAASLPGVVSPVIGMPDIHEGFGLPIGGIMATKNLISVGAVGMDINCGVRLLTSQLQYEPQFFSIGRLKSLIHQIENMVPIGLGGKHGSNTQSLSLEKIVEQGVKYLVKNSYALKEDLESIEEGGCLTEANFNALTPRAVKRARNQLGTLGSGNHFIEIQKISQIFDPELAKKWNLRANQICIMVHTGSRALGHQTCLDYTNIFWKAKNKYGLEAPRKSLAALPINSPEGNRYFGAMAAAVNFAFSNRAMITYYLRQIFQKEFQSPLALVYDVAHNIAKWENHHGQRLLVHRKGATRATPDHPAIVPGSMGAASYVMIGLEKNKETFNSINHGAGRLMSRRQAKRTINQKDFEQTMQNIVVNKPFWQIVDEAPSAYKNIHEVIDTLVEAGLTKKVAQLQPLAVIKGD